MIRVLDSPAGRFHVAERPEAWTLVIKQIKASPERVFGIVSIGVFMWRINLIFSVSSVFYGSWTSH